jgi:transposase InsO family protein
MYRSVIPVWRERTNESLEHQWGKVHHPTYAFQYTHMDVIGPFPRSTNGNKYLLTFVDELTKFMEAIPLAEISAQTCARAYAAGIVARHGSSTYLITDKGTNFTSAFFNETYRILGVKHLNTSAYHHQANGSIERTHSTMCRSIIHYINASGSNWDTFVPFYMMAYNSCHHTVTNFSPFYMLLGREPVLPTIQGHQLKLSPDIRGTDNEARLRQLHKS